MAIERGVDQFDIEELDIEDNSKEILIGEEVSSDQMIDSMGDDDIQTLDDGTMVVIEEAQDLIGQRIPIVVTGALQTPTGRMVFSKIEKDQPPLKSDTRKNS